MEIVRSIVVWVLQIFASELAGFLLIAGVPTLLGVLRKKAPDWAGVVLYVAAGLALALVIWGGSLGILRYQNASAITTTQNIEGLVSTWSSRFQLSVKKQHLSGSDGEHFHYVLTLVNGLHVTVIRTVERDDYLTLRGRLKLSDKDVALFNALSPEERAVLGAQLGTELAKHEVGFTYNLPEFVQVERAIPITDQLTESTFIENVNRIDTALMLVKFVFVIDFLSNN